MVSNNLNELKKYVKMGNFVSLVLTNQNNTQKVNTNLIKYLTTEAKMPGVYITINKPYSVLKRDFEAKKINTNLVIFIDAISNDSEKSKKVEGCLFVNSPKSLSDISIALSEAINKIPSKNKFVFFDSLSTLLMYNDPNTVGRFVHFIANKMRDWKVSGMILSLDNNAKADASGVSQFVDVLLDFSKEAKE